MKWSCTSLFICLLRLFCILFYGLCYYSNIITFTLNRFTNQNYNLLLTWSWVFSPSFDPIDQNFRCHRKNKDFHLATNTKKCHHNNAYNVPWTVYQLMTPSTKMSGCHINLLVNTISHQQNHAIASNITK